MKVSLIRNPIVKGSAEAVLYEEVIELINVLFIML